eukprot:COSAG02_NODE_33516_length_498_cov_15.884712_1_plen_112_part_00
MRAVDLVAIRAVWAPIKTCTYHWGVAGAGEKAPVAQMGAPHAFLGSVRVPRKATGRSRGLAGILIRNHKFTTIRRTVDVAAPIVVFTLDVGRVLPSCRTSACRRKIGAVST